jgi:hypothetical protein
VHLEVAAVDAVVVRIRGHRAVPRVHRRLAARVGVCAGLTMPSVMDEDHACRRGGGGDAAEPLTSFADPTVQTRPSRVLAQDEEEEAASGSTRSAAAWRLHLWRSRSQNWPLSLRFFARTLYRPRVQTDAAGHGARESGNRFEVALQNAKATLVSFGAPGHGIAALRRRRLVADSPRILARDDRAAHLAGEVEPPR